jgi:hypothetical protein
LTLQLGPGLGTTTSVTGQLSDSDLTLTYPGAAAGSLIAIDFTPAQLADYNQAVSDLQLSEYASPCTLYLVGHDVQVQISGSGASSDCASFLQGAQPATCGRPSLRARHRA